MLSCKADAERKSVLWFPRHKLRVTGCALPAHYHYAPGYEKIFAGCARFLGDAMKGDCLPGNMSNSWHTDPFRIGVFGGILAIFQMKHRIANFADMAWILRMVLIAFNAMKIQSLR